MALSFLKRKTISWKRLEEVREGAKCYWLQCFCTVIISFFHWPEIELLIAANSFSSCFGLQMEIKCGYMSHSAFFKMTSKTIFLRRGSSIIFILKGCTLNNWILWWSYNKRRCSRFHLNRDYTCVLFYSKMYTAK